MKSKYTLKPWVKATLLLLPEMIIICQLFFVGIKLNKLIKAQEEKIVVTEMRCYYE